MTRNRSISAGLEPVLNHMEKSSIASCRSIDNLKKGCNTSSLQARYNQSLLIYLDIFNCYLTLFNYISFHPCYFAIYFEFLFYLG